MNEENLGRRVAWHLDRGLDQLDQGTVSALVAARRAALSRSPVFESRSAAAMALAGSRSARSGARRSQARWWVPVGAIAVAVAALLYVQTLGQSPGLSPNYELGAVDAGLLADELPIGAYLDKGFDAWLDDTSE
jgi:hypothetical protein